MKTFTCACGARLFFENSTCLACARELGFLPDRLTLSALEPRGARYAPADGAGEYTKCQNYVEHGVCNWMIPAGEPQTLCLACRLNNVIPNLELAESRALWAEVERAKRRLIYSLSRLGLPLTAKSEDPQSGLAFDIKAADGGERVLTGHADGLITLNLSEADPVAREQTRIAMKERYRTLLGHFRHEIGHYYWERLIRDTDQLGPFRERFGDERTSYAEALQRHYGANTAASEPSDAYVSGYAMTHPWEDWAETFAHYLHIVDTLETARHFGFVPDVAGDAGQDNGEFDRLMRDWIDLTVALNALNRSMGLADAYPFAISSPVRDKLEFVHRSLAAFHIHGADRGGPACGAGGLRTSAPAPS